MLQNIPKIKIINGRTWIFTGEYENNLPVWKSDINGIKCSLNCEEDRIEQSLYEIFSNWPLRLEVKYG